MACRVLKVSTSGFYEWRGQPASARDRADAELANTIAAIHTNLAPFYVMLIALTFGGAVSGRQVVGAILVAAGALLAQLSSAGRTAA